MNQTVLNLKKEDFRNEHKAWIHLLIKPIQSFFCSIFMESLSASI